MGVSLCLKNVSIHSMSYEGTTCRQVGCTVGLHWYTNNFLEDFPTELDKYAAKEVIYHRNDKVVLLVLVHVFSITVHPRLHQNMCTCVLTKSVLLLNQMKLNNVKVVAITTVNTDYY